VSEPDSDDRTAAPARWHAYLHKLRVAEVERVAARIPSRARILEIGAGTGSQTQALRARGFEVAAIDVPHSNYRDNRLVPIVEYDGRHIPYPDARFDVVYSSSVLEHVQDLAALHAEIKRVLAPGGRCIHVLPTHVWRFWTTVNGVPSALVQIASLGAESARRRAASAERRAQGRELARRIYGELRRALHPARHGERGNVLSELWLFHPRWWQQHFREHGFEVVADEPMGLFYTGEMLFADRVTLARRAQASAWLGSACHLFELRPVR
jgi:SAM-dependent methyltransferase